MSASTGLRQFLNRHGRRLVVGLPLVWLLVFFAMPLVEVAQTSFTEPRRGIPPFCPSGDLAKTGSSPISTSKITGCLSSIRGTI